MAVVPRAVVWYGVYCYLNAMAHFAAATLLVWFCNNWRGVIPESADYDEAAWAIVAIGATFATMALVFGIVYLALPRYRGKHAWEAHTVNIVLGAGSIVLTPIALPLLFAWFRPEIKAFYGAEPDGLVVS